MSDPCYRVISDLEKHSGRLDKEAIVLAQSLINTGCNCDRVVLVDSNISQEGKNILKLFFVL